MVVLICLGKYVVLYLNRCERWKSECWMCSARGHIRAWVKANCQPFEPFWDEPNPKGTSTLNVYFLSLKLDVHQTGVTIKESLGYQPTNRLLRHLLGRPKSLLPRGSVSMAAACLLAIGSRRPAELCGWRRVVCFLELVFDMKK